AFIVEASRIAIDDNAQRYAIDSRTDSAVIQGRAGINGNRVRVCRIAVGRGARFKQEFKLHAHVVTGAAYQEIVGGPFAGLVLAPCLAQPFAVRFEAAAGHHTGARFDALVADAGRDESTSVQFQGIDRSVVTYLHAQVFSAAVVGIDQCLAAAHEKRVGAGDVQRARQRGLKAHTVLAHPVATGRRGAYHHAGKLLVGNAARHLEQVLPELFFGVGVHQYVLGRVVHATQIARVL